MYNTILFDLDGTVIDSFRGVTNSIKYALNKYGLPVKDDDTLKTFLGPPLLESFSKHYHLPEEKASELVDLYREYYTAQGIFENDIYDGIPELLRALRENGKKVVLATFKPEVYARKILDHLDLTKYFDHIAGASLEPIEATKDVIIRNSLIACNVKDFSEAVMVGDRKYDIHGANNVGIDSIGVLFGYGSREEFEESGATYIVETPEDVLKIVL